MNKIVAPFYLALSGVLVLFFITLYIAGILSALLAAVGVDTVKRVMNLIKESLLKRRVVK
jgi:small neutral amino acid transporter SnatA (MarC family)